MNTHLIYKDEMINMSEYMNNLDDDTRTKLETDKFKEIVSWIEFAGKLSKQEIIDKLGWGRGIKWTPYRSLYESS